MTMICDVIIYKKLSFSLQKLVSIKELFNFSKNVPNTLEFVSMREILLKIMYGL